MSEIETQTEVDPIETIYQSEVPSLSERSMLGYEVGRHAEDGTLHLRIVSNSGGGMWCKDWASAGDIQSTVIGATELSAKSFHQLHSGRSINTGGFVLAALKGLGFIRPNAENTRLHEHVPTTTFEQVVMARIAESMEQVPKSSRRKAKEG
jgi:hypothetical protein